MSRSYFTKAKIHVSLFPQRDGQKVLLGDKIVTRQNYSDVKSNKYVFQLIDENDLAMGLFFDQTTGFLKFFDFKYWHLGSFGGPSALWMRWAVLSANRKGINKLPPAPKVKK